MFHTECSHTIGFFCTCCVTKFILFQFLNSKTIFDHIVSSARGQFTRMEDPEQKPLLDARAATKETPDNKVGGSQIDPLVFWSHLWTRRPAQPCKW